MTRNEASGELPDEVPDGRASVVVRRGRSGADGDDPHRLIGLAVLAMHSTVFLELVNDGYSAGTALTLTILVGRGAVEIARRFSRDDDDGVGGTGGIRWA